jgi:hypothetical protein
MIQSQKDGSQSKGVREHQFIFKEFDLAQLSNGWVFTCGARCPLITQNADI